MIVIKRDGKTFKKLLLKVHNEMKINKIQVVLNVNSPLICNANALKIKSIKYINNAREPKLTIKIAITVKKLINKSIKYF